MVKIARRVCSVQPASLHAIQLWDDLFLLFSFLSLHGGVTRPQSASLKNGKLGGWAGGQVYLHSPLPCVDSHFVGSTGCWHYSGLYWNNVLTPGLYSWLLIAFWEILPPSEIRQGRGGICSQTMKESLKFMLPFAGPLKILTSFRASRPNSNVWVNPLPHHQCCYQGCDVRI